MRTGGRMDGRTGMTKLIVAFQYFANAPKNEGYQLTEIVAWLLTFDLANCHLLCVTKYKSLAPTLRKEHALRIM